MNRSSSLLKTLSARHSEERSDEESLFLLAFGEEEFLDALAMTGPEAFFNKLLYRRA